MISVLNIDICHPKSKTIIIPANQQGIMSYGIAGKVTKEGFKGIEKEAKEYIKLNPVNLTDVFSTYPGRLNRRGVKKIYHAVVKRFPNDFISLDTIKKAINNAFKAVIQDGWDDVSICSFGTEDGEIDEYVSAYWIVDIANRYKTKINIKIVDENKKFIKEVKKIIEI